MGFDVKLANQLAGVCRWIYATNAEGAANVDERFTLLRGFRSSGLRATSYAAIVDLDGRLVVAFRGTEPTVEDWTRDIEAAPVPFTVPAGVVGAGPTTLDGIAHSGFLLELNAVLPAIVAELRTKHAGRPVIVTGHSQGGAVAVLASVALAAAGITVDGVYTFEAARAGDRTLCDRVAQPCYRIEFGNDVVPHVPPDGLVLEERIKTLEAVAAGLAEFARSSAARAAATAAPAAGAGAASTTASVTPAGVADRVKAALDSTKGFFAKIGAFFSGGSKTLDALGVARDGVRQLLADGAPRVLFDSVRKAGVTKYRSAGRLVYLERQGDKVVVRTDLTADDEKALFFARLKGLCSLSRSRDIRDLFQDHGVDAWRAHLK